MIRILKPFYLGAIIISIIMALSLYVPILIVTLLLVIFFIINYFFAIPQSKIVLLILSAVFISSLSLLRIKWQSNSSYISGFSGNILTGDIFITTDSSSSNGKYTSKGLITSIYNHQFSIKSRYPVTIISKCVLYSGYTVKKASINKFNGNYTSYIDDQALVISLSNYHLYRKEILEVLLSKMESPLLSALLTGRKDNLSPDIISLFRKCGCSHILALSGFHVGIIVILVMVLLRMFCNKKTSCLITIMFLLLYVCIAGKSPSLLRSFIMFATGVYYRISGRKISVSNILFISFYIVIILYPQCFYTLSFQLSYLALCGILFASGEIILFRGIRRLPYVIKMPISVSISAMIFTSFICIPVFGELYPVGVIASLFITPVVTIYIWLGIFSLVFPVLKNILEYIEIIIIKILEHFSIYPYITESGAFSYFILLIFFIIPVILIFIKYYRRLNARRFNTKFKL